MYRDQLQADEQTTLDAYLKELSKVQAARPRSRRTGGDGSRVPASTATPAPRRLAAGSGIARRRPDRRSRSRRSRRRAVTADAKQQARWLLHEAREQIRLGNYEAAEKKVAEAEALDVKWGLFDDTPAKVRDDLNKARPKTVAAAAKPVATQPGDHKAAKAKLREARAALANHQFEQAEAIALEVKGWNLSYGLFEDNPDKVAAAARALRQRDKIRNTPPREQASQGVYDILVQESRQLIEARQARRGRGQGAPGPADERGPVADGRSGRGGPPRHRDGPCPEPRRGGSPADARPVAEPASVVAEREANELLAKGDQAKAAAKFAEAERLRATESRRPAPSPRLARRRRLDPAVQTDLGRPSRRPRPDCCAAAGRTSRPAADSRRAPAGRRRRAPAPAEPEADAARRRRARRGRPARSPARGRQPPAGQPGRATARRGQGPLHQRQLPRRPADWPSEAKAGKFGVDAQADELLAQIGLAEQGGALSLYESALAAMRNGDNGRARALLTEVAAAGDSLDESLRAEGPGPAREAPADDDGASRHGRRRRHEPGRARRRGPRRPEAQRRGRHQDRRGPPAPGDRPRQGDRHLRADPEGRQGRRAFART